MDNKEVRVPRYGTWLVDYVCAKNSTIAGYIFYQELVRDYPYMTGLTHQEIKQYHLQDFSWSGSVFIMWAGLGFRAAVLKLVRKGRSLLWCR